MRILGMLILLGLGPALATAQVVTDGSMGAEGPVAGGSLPDGSFANFRIDEGLGQRAGGNLFHSFAAFGVPGGTTAAFTAELPTERVLARVTGGAASVISGRLASAIPGADLYLMNPSGVVFSGGSSLDVQGSFHVSTAHSLRFADGTSFAATPLPSETLSVSTPEAWGFLGPANAPVTIRGCASCGVPSGETLSAVGGGVFVRGQGAIGTRLSAPGGRILLAARLSAGEVPLDVTSLPARNSEPDSLGSVRIGPGATLSVSDPLGGAGVRGQVVIRGGSLVLESATIAAESGADPAGDARDIDVETRDSIEIASRSDVAGVASGNARGGTVRLSSASISLLDASSVRTVAGESATAGSLEVEADSVLIARSALLQTFAFADATAGRISVDADEVELREGASIVSANAASREAREIQLSTVDLRLDLAGQVRSETFAGGRGAPIVISAERFDQARGGLVTSFASSDDTGAGGDIAVSAGELALRGAGDSGDPGGIFSSAVGVGAAGDVRLSGASIRVEGGAQISSTTSGSGSAGDIAVVAEEVLLAGRPAGIPSGIFARSGLLGVPGATGSGGDISVTTSRLDVIDGAEISAQSSGSGASGDVRLHATESVRIASSALFASSINSKTFDGPGGDVEIETPDLLIEDGGEISVSTLFEGDAGDVRIAAERVRIGGGGGEIAGSGIFAQTLPSFGETPDGGDGGNILIRVDDRLELHPGGTISANTFGAGRAGRIEISGAKLVSLEGGAISALSRGPGQGGTINLTEIGTLRVGRDGRITTRAVEDGGGGSISIRAKREVVVSDGGEISATSERLGDAGSISIFAGQQLTLRDGGRITTQAETAFGGNIDLRARHLLYVQDAEITTSVDQGAGDGGNITIDPEFVVLNGGTIAARANAGNGGNILIRTDHFVADATSSVDASSALGIDGQIEITSPETDLTGELARLEGEYLDASSQLARACAARSVERGTFAVRASAARPPDGPLESTETGAVLPCPER